MGAGRRGEPGDCSAGGAGVVLMSLVMQAYRFALDPTAVQEAMLRSHCGGQRFAYNWGLAQIRANLSQREAERSYGVSEDALTPSVNWSAYGLRKYFNQVKGTVAPWWAENSKECYASGLANLSRALGNWSASKRDSRSGPTVRFPRFHGKRVTPSVRFTTGAFGLGDSDRRHVTLPRIGLVRTHESTRKLARHVERGTARIRSVCRGGRAGGKPHSPSRSSNPTRSAPARAARSVWTWV